MKKVSFMFVCVFLFVGALSANAQKVGIDSASVKGYVQFLNQNNEFKIGHGWVIGSIYSGNTKLFGIIAKKPLPTPINFLTISHKIRFKNTDAEFRVGKFEPAAMNHVWWTESPGTLLIPRHPLSDSLLVRDFGVGLSLRRGISKFWVDVHNGQESISEQVGSNPNSKYDISSRMELSLAPWVNFGLAARTGKGIEQRGIDYWGEGQHWKLTAGVIKHQSKSGWFVEPVVKLGSLAFAARYEKGLGLQGWTYGFNVKHGSYVLKVWMAEKGFVGKSDAGLVNVDLELHL